MGVETVFTDDICPVKAALYCENWGREELNVGDIRALSGKGYSGRLACDRFVSLR